MDDKVLADRAHDFDERERRSNSSIMGSTQPGKHNHLYRTFGLCEKWKFLARNYVKYDRHGQLRRDFNVVSAGSNREDKHLVVGMTSGVLSIRTRLSGQQKIKEREREKEMQALIAGTLEDYDKKNKKRTRGVEKKFRGLDFVGEGADVIIEGKDRTIKRKSESGWEKDLRQGKYQRALDAVLEEGIPPVTVLTLLTALKHRSATRAAFQGRDESTVQPIIKWVSKHIKDPRYVLDIGVLKERRPRIYSFWSSA
ncbi:putative U3 small nucleolar RNA-associated protein 15 [Glarea lozoyensis 74030]|uniref:Putative U3 small nucleolar RNA-associated protein 15 n=1 Tax=Glarea lozoyensis (strain ATCC 74030 / MF5533) TaxID=1104152 RepID=H0ESI3_GLAL7|nr:putative U3 small nucleolar RNA-associated protein 15 [Glarea lozoyensis 74030]